MNSKQSGNAEQVDFWNGDAGLKWVRNQARLDRAFRSLTAALIGKAAPRPGERVIDIGCGCGDLSLSLAGLVGAEGRVFAVDVSRPMLGQARARAEAEGGQGRAAVEWREGDAALLPFAEGGFDLLMSRFGVMFFSDPVAAFQNMRRALRPGGRLAMLCWRSLDDNPWVSVPRAAMLQIVPAPEPMPPNAPGPFAFADATRVTGILARAGFAGIESTVVEASLETSPDPEAAGEAALEHAVQFAVELGPASALLRDADPATMQRAVSAVRAALSERSGTKRPSLGAACWLYTATNPGQ